jgi:2-polyprenyl-6-methoxyphenol hydroxylase-like FAD-dependent oxidoreductase
LLVERHPDLLSHPRQRSLSVRTLELYRQVGLHDRIQAARLDFAGPADYVAVRAQTLASVEYEPVQQQGNAGHAAASSPCVGTPIDQDRVEALLRERALELGAELRFGSELCDFSQDDKAIYAQLSDVDRKVKARYLVAADGVRSSVRQRLGVPMTSYGQSSRMLSLLVDADLRPALAGRTVHMAYLRQPRPTTFLMALDNDGQRWAFGTAEGDEVDHAELVRAAAGLPDLEVRLRPQVPGTDKTALTFEFGAEIAETFRVGRVFLAGDAAHLMPPTGGFGGAAGVQDGHNLAWKLAAVLRGQAGDGLLDTYDQERRPVADFTLRQALARAGSRFGDGKTDEIVDRWKVLLGYRYGGPPVDVLELKAQPGTRAPHVLMPDGRSTLDLYGSGFVLLIGPDGDAWRATELPVEVVRIQATAEHGIADDGAVLVRPDGFVAWRRSGPDARLPTTADLLSAPG